MGTSKNPRRRLREKTEEANRRGNDVIYSPELDHTC